MREKVNRLGVIVVALRKMLANTGGRRVWPMVGSDEPSVPASRPNRLRGAASLLVARTQQPRCGQGVTVEPVGDLASRENEHCVTGPDVEFTARLPASA